MRRACLFALMSLPLVAQSSAMSGGMPPLDVRMAGGLLREPLFISQVFVASSAVADVQSSWGRYELNPVLGRGQFGARQAAISAGITGGLLLLERPLVRHHPSLRKPLTVVNFVVSGIRFGVAAQNWGQR